MTKTLLEDEAGFEAFKKMFGPHTTPKTRLNLNIDIRPTSYPCIAVWYEWDNPNGPFECECEFVYPTDFTP
jgi:hypothetical protein